MSAARLTPSQEWVKRAYRSQRVSGFDPIPAAQNVRDSYARMCAEQALDHGAPRREMLDGYRCAKQWLAHVIARETAARPGIDTLMSALRASTLGPAVAQAVSA